MRVNEEGGPLRPERVEVAPPGPGRVRVDVVACGVRGADVRTARGVGAALPATPGHEVTGVVADPGGWAQSLTAPSDALARIPDGLDFLDAAPMGCAGVTTFNAVRHAGLAAGARVAVFGLGGLGHLAVQFAAKMGHEVVAPGDRARSGCPRAGRQLRRRAGCRAPLGGADLIVSTVNGVRP